MATRKRNPEAAQEPRGKPGRPTTHVWPDQIPDTPENVLRAVLATPEKRRDEWEYMKRRRAGGRRKGEG